MTSMLSAISFLVYECLCDKAAVAAVAMQWRALINEPRSWVDVKKGSLLERPGLQ